MTNKRMVAERIADADSAMPPRATWWTRHGQASSLYLALSADPRPAAKREARAIMRGQVDEWARWTPKGAGRDAGMARHAALEADLVDAARRGDVEEVVRIGNLLVDDAADQARRLGSTVASFPEERFKRLFEEHVRLFVGLVRASIEGKDPGRRAKAAEANALALADMTVEWF